MAAPQEEKWLVTPAEFTALNAGGFPAGPECEAGLAAQARVPQEAGVSGMCLDSGFPAEAGAGGRQERRKHVCRWAGMRRCAALRRCHGCGGQTARKQLCHKTLPLPLRAPAPDLSLSLK